MPKLYMDDTALQELEQMMMLIPNFIPRGSEVIVVKKFKKIKKPAGCQNCANNCYNDDSCPYIEEKLAGGLIDYKSIMYNFSKKCDSKPLNKRLDTLVENFDGEIFLSPMHNSRFHKVIRMQNISIENKDPNYLAMIFLLTADNNLWEASKEHIYLSSIEFKKMQLHGINTDGYALYQTARTINYGREHIKLDEISDKSLISDQAFKVIINAILLLKYGAALIKYKIPSRVTFL